MRRVRKGGGKKGEEEKGGDILRLALVLSISILFRIDSLYKIRGALIVGEEKEKREKKKKKKQKKTQQLPSPIPNTPPPPYMGERGKEKKKKRKTFGLAPSLPPSIICPHISSN